MTSEWRLDTLPVDVLFLIFDCCDSVDLIRLSEVCSRFHEIVSQDVLWIKRIDEPLVTNQASKKFRDRCYTVLSLCEKWRVSQNWLHGKYKQRVIRSWRIRAMPLVHLMKDSLWWSNGNELCGFHRKRKKNSKSPERYLEADKIFSTENFVSDVLDLAVRDECVIAGHRDRYISAWSTSDNQAVYPYLYIPNAHCDEVTAIDEVSGNIISGSKDNHVKIWSHTRDGNTGPPLAEVNVCDRVWCLSANAKNGKCVVGSSSTGNNSPLTILDVESFHESRSLRHQWQYGAGVLDVLWENSNILLTCGYDTCVRKWDMRTGTCIASWSDPTDATVYCLSSDHQHTIITGTQFNCKAVLWDQRMSNYMQLYFLRNCGRQSSPVYDIAFDTSSLYATTDRCLIQLAFSGYNDREANYSNVLNSHATANENVIR